MGKMVCLGFFGLPIATAADLLDVYRSCSTIPNLKQPTAPISQCRGHTSSFISVITSHDSRWPRQPRQTRRKVFPTAYDAIYSSTMAGQCHANPFQYQAKLIFKPMPLKPQATFNNAAQDLILRVSQAYLDALLSHRYAQLADKKRANKRQYDNQRTL